MPAHKKKTTTSISPEATSTISSVEPPHRCHTEFCVKSSIKEASKEEDS